MRVTQQNVGGKRESDGKEEEREVDRNDELLSLFLFVSLSLFLSPPFPLPLSFSFDSSLKSNDDDYRLSFFWNRGTLFYLSFPKREGKNLFLSLSLFLSLLGILL